MSLTPSNLQHWERLFSDPMTLTGYFIIASMTLAMCCFACAIYWLGQFHKAYIARTKVLEQRALVNDVLAMQAKTDRLQAETFYNAASLEYHAMRALIDRLEGKTQYVPDVQIKTGKKETAPPRP